VTGDHHSAYLARAVAALTPDGHRKVDALLEQLVAAAPGHAWLVRFAKVREEEADDARLAGGDDPVRMLGDLELDGLISGFMTIRDQEPLDDVADWANAVLALLHDEERRRRG
jgi:hypothetical protein